MTKGMNAIMTTDVAETAIEKISEITTRTIPRVGLLMQVTGEWILIITTEESAGDHILFLENIQDILNRKRMITTPVQTKSRGKQITIIENKPYGKPIVWNKYVTVIESIGNEL